MPEIPTDQVELEKLVRGLVVTLFSGIEGLPAVLPHRVYIENEAEAVRTFGYKHPSGNKTEFRILIVDFESFEDTEDGCEDNPVFNLVYALKLVVSHQDPRPDLTTSTDDFARFVMTMRSRVLADRHLGDYARLRCENLTVSQPMEYGIDDETLIVGHIGQYELRVRVDPIE